MTPALGRGSRKPPRSGSGRRRGIGRPRGTADATCEPEPGPVPEAVFDPTGGFAPRPAGRAGRVPTPHLASLDRVTGPLGPYLRRVARIAPALPGARALGDEGA
jgi:hypothetical protein